MPPLDGTQCSKVGLLNVGPFYNLYMGSGVHYKPHGPRLDFIISLSFDLLVLCGVYIYDFNGNYFFHLTNHLYDIHQEGDCYKLIGFFYT